MSICGTDPFTFKYPSHLYLSFTVCYQDVDYVLFLEWNILFSRNSGNNSTRDRNIFDQPSVSKYDGGNLIAHPSFGLHYQHRCPLIAKLKLCRHIIIPEVLT